jgi:hypothetical protein
VPRETPPRSMMGVVAVMGRSDGRIDGVRVGCGLLGLARSQDGGGVRNRGTEQESEARHELP